MEEVRTSAPWRLFREYFRDLARQAWLELRAAETLEDLSTARAALTVLENILQSPSHLEAFQQNVAEELVQMQEGKEPNGTN